jgi:hypothetical protein
MLPIQPNGLKQNHIGPAWIAEAILSPSVYACAGLMLSTGYAWHLFHHLGIVPLPVQPGTVIHADWRHFVRAVLIFIGMAALVSFPFVLTGAILQARKRQQWHFVNLNIGAATVWFFGLF